MVADAYSLTSSPAAAPVLHGAPSFSIPLADQVEFARLKEKWRKEITATLAVLRQAHAIRVRGGYSWVSGTLQLAACHRHVHGLSAGRIRAKYSAYIQSGGDWRSLVKDYQTPGGGQPEEFIQFIRALIEQSPRGAAAAISHLRDELWPSGTVSIPGYGTWREWFARTWNDQPVPTRFPRLWPAGWHPDNLSKYKSSRACRAFMQQGYGAAHAFLPKLKRDTSELRPMEIIVIDDFELDHLCTFPGDPERGIAAQTCPVGGLLAKCVGTRKNLAWLLGPRPLRDEKQKDGTIKKVRWNVRALDVQALLYEVFRRNGLPDYDVTILCETRSATISRDLEQFLLVAFEGRVRVQRTSLIEHKTLANGFVEGGGTPWEKGWIESDFNYLWNQLALRLDGYKGSNQRLNGPGDIDDKKAHVLRLIGADVAGKCLALPPELVSRLRLPFPNPATVERAFADVMHLGERRTRHRFNGFDKVTEYRWRNPKLAAPAGIDPFQPNPYEALAVLTPEQQELMTVPEERNESPLERWSRLSTTHPRRELSAPVLALFLLTPNEATWRNHAVTFSKKPHGGFSYVDDDGILAEVPEGTKLLAYVDFNAAESAVVTHLDGRPLGVVRMLGTSNRGVDITDPEATDKARARRARLVNIVEEMLRARPLHQQTDARLAADRQQCEEVVAAYREATADVPAAEQLAVARGEIAAEAAAAKRRARPEKTSKRLADLAGVPAPAPADAAPAASLADLLG